MAQSCGEYMVALFLFVPVVRVYPETFQIHLKLFSIPCFIADLSNNENTLADYKHIRPLVFLLLLCEINKKLPMIKKRKHE